MVIEKYAKIFRSAHAHSLSRCLSTQILKISRDHNTIRRWTSMKMKLLLILPQLLLLVPAVADAEDGSSSSSVAPPGVRGYSPPRLMYLGRGLTDLGPCEGNCDTDDQCRGHLKCFLRADYDDGLNSDQDIVTKVTGCSGLVEPRVDYCYDPTATTTTDPEVIGDRQVKKTESLPSPSQLLLRQDHSSA